MAKQIISSPTSPKPIGPYSHAVEANGMVFTSGQVALDAESGQMKNETVEMETEQVMINLEKILNSAGLTFDNVIKSTIFLTNLDHFGTVNEVYGKHFSAGNYPARETVQVVRLPRDARVEISVIAVR